MILLLQNIFFSTAWAQAQGAGASGGDGGPMSKFLSSPLMPLVPIVLIFYFLMIRPQQKQQKERRRMLAELKKGDPVVTTSGIYGRITGVADKILTVEIADNVRVRMDREAVGRMKMEEGGEKK